MDRSTLIVHSRIRYDPNILRTTAYALPQEDVFVFQIKVRDKFGPYQSPLHPGYWDHDSSHISLDVRIPIRDIVGNGTDHASHIINGMLEEVCIPSHKRRPLLSKIQSKAVRLARLLDAEGEYKRIPIMVELHRVYPRRIRNGDGVVPARRSANEGLERVRVKETEACAVCLEEMGAGSEGTMLPCKHIFHGRCIHTWLEKADLCPLCRFQLSHRTLTSLRNI
nr:E3 ubiquitin-protein ligase RING1-like [Ipomoea batatas]